MRCRNAPVGLVSGDDFALFGGPQLSGNGSGRLCGDGPTRGGATDRPTTPMKEDGAEPELFQRLSDLPGYVGEPVHILQREVLTMIADPEYQACTIHRTAALEDARLIPMHS